ncbi:MAG: alpha/beta fold hydrolase [Betaproteobacteria bacterium]|nr:MAG: alpha/beta fold hydrolase [Betaproteobacteria bacterium]
MKRKLVAAGTLWLVCLASTLVSFASQAVAAPDTPDAETVVLLHGLGRSSTSMWIFALRLKRAGFHVELVGYDSINQNPDEILEEISEQIRECCAKVSGRIHFVGHSLGGLMVRAYLQNNDVANLGRVVLMGTPNQGTVAADYFRDTWLLKRLGPTAERLGTDENSFPRTLEAPYYPVGIIAGEFESDLIDNVIPGKDDGLVPVDATKLEGMDDFIVLQTSHAMMRYDEEVARQTIEFLKNGRFDHENKID